MITTDHIKMQNIVIKVIIIIKVIIFLKNGTIILLTARHNSGDSGMPMYQNRNHSSATDNSFRERVAHSDDIRCQCHRQHAEDCINNDDYSLYAGTSWFFVDPRMNKTLDYLFIDEAGQVALGQQ